MGGVVGAVSGKFVLVAAGLLVDSRVGHERVRALIDASLARTEISRSLADRLDPHGAHRDGDELAPRRGTTVGLGAREFDAPKLIIGASRAPKGVDLVIGRDVLEAERLELDFARDQLSLVTPAEYKAAVRGRVRVPLTPAGPGLWRLNARLGPGGEKDGALDLTSPAALMVNGVPVSPCPDIGFGAVRLQPTACAADTTSTLPFRLGWRGFATARVLLALPDRSLWIAPSRTER
ncbi:hypothetical protein [uncultured Caulobacter sp.]|uniref:hypothetical protein n=1 Tax=uncultured Caulobacter sp. TaxID=158749 RepID=UPI00260519A2|nr:hypothetical protein [uncultured Caulobacter sp.]